MLLLTKVYKGMVVLRAIRFLLSEVLVLRPYCKIHCILNESYKNDLGRKLTSLFFSRLPNKWKDSETCQLNEHLYINVYATPYVKSMLLLVV